MLSLKTIPIRTVAGVLSTLVLAPEVALGESCPGCTGLFVPGTQFYVDGYEVSVVPMQGSDSSGKCYYSTSDNACEEAHPCNFGLFVSWIVPSGGSPAAGQWCTSQLTPVATDIECDDTGTYFTTGSANHRERISCGSSYYMQAWLGESVATFGLGCTACVN